VGDGDPAEAIQKLATVGIERKRLAFNGDCGQHLIAQRI